MDALVKLYKAIGDVSRLKLLRLLAEDEYCVCELVEVMGFSQSAVSQHLSRLKDAGLVQERRQGLWTYYRLESDSLKEIQAVLAAFMNCPIAEIPEMETEAQRLSSLDRVNCC